MTKNSEAIRHCSTTVWWLSVSCLLWSLGHGSKLRPDSLCLENPKRMPKHRGEIGGNSTMHGSYGFMGRHPTLNGNPNHG